MTARPKLLWLVVAITLISCGGRARTLAFSAAVSNVESAGSLAEMAGAAACASTSTLRARMTVTGAVLAAYPSPAGFRRTAFLDSIAAGDLATASLLVHFWEPAATDTDAFGAYVRLLTQTGRSSMAEELAWQAAVDHPDIRPTLIRLWYEALAADPLTIAPPDPAMIPGGGAGELEAFNGSSSVIFKLLSDGETIGVFKPHQSVRHQFYRGEIAAYRLCALIRCSLLVPRSRELRMTEVDFRALTGIGPRDPTRFYARNSDVIFFTDDDETRWLYGVAKDWVPDFCRFPIEYTDVWEELVRVGVDAERLSRQPLESALDGLRGRDRGFFRQITERSTGVTAYDLARQISELHVFDLLINNFDRYQPRWYGMNAHWTEGRFVSIDNGASFQTYEEHNWRTVRRRIQRVEVFSRSMIDALRWMDDPGAFAILFPTSPFHDDDEERFAYFVERRDWLLSYVDSLVAEHGVESVFLFP